MSCISSRTYPRAPFAFPMPSRYLHLHAPQESQGYHVKSQSSPFLMKGAFPTGHPKRSHNQSWKLCSAGSSPHP